MLAEPATMASIFLTSHEEDVRVVELGGGERRPLTKEW